jgi:hypothetical protein
MLGERTITSTGKSMKRIVSQGCLPLQELLQMNDRGKVKYLCITDFTLSFYFYTPLTVLGAAVAQSV